MSAVALDFLLVHHAARRLGITSGGRSEHQNCALTMGLIALLARLRWNPAYQLAWLRIATGRNLQHKRFFRDLYGAYEAGLDANLALLHEKLIGGWKATPPMRIYLPKASGLLRPITLLAIEDQIVLQAIANRIASHLSERRRKVDFIIRRLGKLPLELSYLWRSHAGCGTPLRSRTSPPISTFLTPAPSMKSHLQPGISRVPQSRASERLRCPGRAQPGVGDGDAVSVCAEIAQHMFWPAERPFGVDDQVVPEQ